MVGLKDLYFTIAEAAKELKVSKQTVYRWIEDEKIPTEKIGGIVLVEKKEIQKKVTKKVIDTLTSSFDNTIVEFLKKHLKLNENDIVQSSQNENDTFSFLVTHKNGDKSKVAIEQLNITFSMNLKNNAPFITDVSFENMKVTEIKGAKKVKNKEE
jgi:excisionase family DNA binding protein